MKRHSRWGAWIAAGMLAALSASVALAAPPAQDEQPTPPEATAADAAPTSTALPPPSGGGRVVVPVLNVRSGPSVGWPRFRALLYGSAVFPVGRDHSGEWIAINISGTVGWVWHEGVVWDPALDIAALPVIEKPSAPSPSETPTVPPSPSPSTMEAAASPTIGVTLTPERTLTATPTLEPSPSATPTPHQEAAIPAQASPVPQAIASSPASPAVTGGSSVVGAGGWFALGGLLVLAALIYGWRWGRGQHEIKRYAGGFPLKTCPTCQSGRLRLEEYVQRPLGVAVLRRSVHCDTCRSVLRQIRPGLWRYTIDPLVNLSLANEYNGHSFADADLLPFADLARAYEPSMRSESPAISEDFERAVEHLTALEQQVLAAEAAEEGASASAEAAEDDTGVSTEEGATS